MNPTEVHRVRRFNRTLTQRIGVLEESYLQRGRPLSEARLIYEIGKGARDLRELRAGLSLDSGYVSRLLRSLEQQALVEVEVNAADARRRTIRLTDAGRAELRAYDRLSNAHAESLLKPLSSDGRRRLLSAMEEIERLLSVSAIEVAVEPPQSVAALWCLEQYFSELDARFEGGFDRDRYMSLSPDSDLTPPSGYLVIAYLDGQPIGCGALKVRDRGVGEIKRVWTAAASRGLGVAQRVLDKIDDLAAKAGVSVLRLSTNRALTEAQRLYANLGFHEVPPYDDDPYSHHWFERRLAETSPGRGPAGPRPNGDRERPVTSATSGRGWVGDHD